MQRSIHTIPKPAARLGVDWHTHVEDDGCNMPLFIISTGLPDILYRINNSHQASASHRTLAMHGRARSGDGRPLASF
jgi:hypothetical protein